MIRWAEEKGIRLIVDESFADFADEADNTFIRQGVKLVCDARRGK